MAAFPTYTTGTVSIASGGTTVTGSGTLWSSINARPGDLLLAGGVLTVVKEVTDPTHFIIPPWAGSTIAGAS